MRSNPPDSSKRKEMFKSFSICHIKAETLFPFADVPHQQRFMWFLQYYCMAKSAEPPSHGKSGADTTIKGELETY